MTSQNDLSIVRNNLSERRSHAKHWLFSALNSWELKFLHTELSYLVLDPVVRRKVSMELGKISKKKKDDVTLYQSWQQPKMAARAQVLLEIRYGALF